MSDDQLSSKQAVQALVSLWSPEAPGKHKGALGLNLKVCLRWAKQWDLCLQASFLVMTFEVYFTETCGIVAAHGKLPAAPSMLIPPANQSHQLWETQSISLPRGLQWQNPLANRQYHRHLPTTFLSSLHSNSPQTVSSFHAAHFLLTTCLNINKMCWQVW